MNKEATLEKRIKTLNKRAANSNQLCFLLAIFESSKIVIVLFVRLIDVFVFLSSLENNEKTDVVRATHVEKRRFSTKKKKELYFYCSQSD